MSELDPERRERLAGALRDGGQALVTTTEADHVPGAAAAGVARIAVVDGTVLCEAVAA
jgi:DNA replication and repair protein RecF